MLHDWRHDIGHDTADRRTEITVTREQVEHMGLYIATGTRAQLSLLADALTLFVQAETTLPSQRGPELDEVAEYIEVWGEVNESDWDASLSAWRTVVRVLTLAITTAPGSRADRPTKLYNTEGILLPTPPADESTPAADTITVLDRIDTGDGRSVQLDDTAWRAWQRLTAEWHAACYGARSNEPGTLLSSYAY